MESVRHAAWKLHSSNGLALKVRRLDDHQVAPVPDWVVDVGQIPAGEFAGLRIGGCENSLSRSTGRGSGTERMFLGSTVFEVVAHEFTRTDGNAVPRRHTGPPIVDARELYSALVDLLFCDRATSQIDRPGPHHRVETRRAIITPQLGIASCFEHDNLAIIRGLIKRVEDVKNVTRGNVKPADRTMWVIAAQHSEPGAVGLNKPDGYLLGSYRIATAPEPNSSRLTDFKSTGFDSPANNVGP